VACSPALAALWEATQERHLKAWRERRVAFREQRRRRLRDFLPAIGARYAESDLDDIFEGYLRAYESSWRAFPDAQPALTELADAGIAVAVLTNGTIEQQTDKLRRTGLTGHGPLFTPEDLGVAKPDPAAFGRACERWGHPPATVLSVGDRHDLDVRPARAAGLQAAHLDRRDLGPHDEPRRLTGLGRIAELLTAWSAAPAPASGPDTASCES
jgi:putative hydrolase of the HAD superfamily